MNKIMSVAVPAFLLLTGMGAFGMWTEIIVSSGLILFALVGMITLLVHDVQEERTRRYLRAYREGMKAARK
jgi:hypothetical protein